MTTKLRFVFHTIEPEPIPADDLALYRIVARAWKTIKARRGQAEIYVDDYAMTGKANGKDDTPK